MPYLIDGHNVISALPDIHLEDEYDEAQLVLKLRAWAGRERRKAIVVFDGGIPGGYARALSSPDIKVVFAARHYTNADRIIKERLGHLPDAGNWTVVSSDYEVLDNARQVGARVLKAQDFAEHLSRPPDADKEKPDTISAAEVEEWLRIFPEPEPPSAPSPPADSHPRRAPRNQRKRSSVPRTRQPPPPATSPKRATRSIGEQLDRPPQTPAKAEPPPKTYKEKPETVSEEEVAAWLEVFQDPPDATIPPPKLKRQKRSSSRQVPHEPSVDKHTDGLSEEDVEAWLAFFGEDLQAPSAPPPPPKPAQKKSPSSRKSSDAHAPTATSRWAKQKRKQAPVEEPDSEGELSAEDLALWQRLYGESE